MKTELIITTYNSPRALNLVLCALQAQTRLPDRIAVADDGSGPETKAVLEKHQPRLPLRHVWHPDTGFGKNEILNKAIASSAADLLIFIDGDCLASAGFIARHIELARPNTFSTGSVVRLNAETSERLNEEDITSKRVFDPQWLSRNGNIKGLSDRLKAGSAPRPLAKFLDKISPVRITWSGGNASTSRAQLIKVNGFDESMRYGGEDKELGSRLLNAGVKGQFLRYSAPLLHIDHPRGYVDPEIVKTNRAKIEDTRKTRRIWADLGLDRHLSA